MISPEIIHVNYIKKEAQTGSYCGMRYRLSKGKNEEGGGLYGRHDLAGALLLCQNARRAKDNKTVSPDPGGLSGSCRVVKRTT